MFKDHLMYYLSKTFSRVQYRIVLDCREGEKF